MGNDYPCIEYKKDGFLQALRVWQVQTCQFQYNSA